MSLASSRSQPDPPSSKTGSLAGRRPTVLVVGDFGGDGDQIAWLLGISGYHAAQVPDVAEAEMFLTQDRCALIVAHVPRSTRRRRDPLGELLAELRTISPGTGVLLIPDRAVDARADSQSGVAGILPRPLDA